jgi:Cytochrome c7 and related cytochrome c/Class III cytochrome C family
MRRYLAPVCVAVAVAVGWIMLLPAIAAHQPIAFPHAKHRTTSCTVCHRGAASSRTAGIPDIAFCAKCHATAPAGTTAVWDAAVTRKSVAWVQVTRVLPAHVMFSHRRHVTLGRLDCSSCHGEMRDRMTPPTAAPVRIAMATCLGCHRQEGAAEDCAACHR